MYRIQAYNLNTKHIEIYKIRAYEYQEFINELRSNPSYGLINSEYIARF